MKINMCFLSSIVKAGLSMAVLLFSAAAGKGKSAFVEVDGKIVLKGIVLNGREAVIDEQDLSQAMLNQGQSQ